MQKKRIMLVGFGPHSKRIYFPLIEELSQKLNFELVLAVDLEEKKEDVLEYIKDKKVTLQFLFIKEPERSYHQLEKKLELKLNKFVDEMKIDGVIIATEPLVHVMYAKWALKKGLSIIMDKPISTYKNISTKNIFAKKLIFDFNELNLLYEEAKKKKKGLTFSLMAQRRFHPAFRKIKDLIKECFLKTNCPVTSIQSFHCDGQWRMPTEMVEQIYHPYMQGYGKCSHSGYHFFDIVPYLLDSGTNLMKNYDNVDVYSKFIRPLDFLEQVTLDDHKKIFGEKIWDMNNKYTKKEYNNLMEKFGEVDAFSNIAFKKGNKIITLATINLIHNGFGRRDWVTANGRDLYKGNGRVRHECHILEQGPFQSIHFHSYQSKEVNSFEKKNLYGVGGEYHLEIYVFRNSGVIGGPSYEKFNINDLNTIFLEGKSRGHQEDARAQGFIEFIESLHGKRNCEEMTSNFSSHFPAVLITSGVYQSAIAQLSNKNPVINLSYINKEKEMVKLKTKNRDVLEIEL